MAAPDQPIVVAQFRGPHGVRGWLKVTSYTDPKENLLGYRPWWIATAQGHGQIEVAQVRAHGEQFVAKIAGIDDRDQAAALSGKEILIERRLLPPLSESDDSQGDEFYWQDLIGMMVVTHDGPEEVGEVIDLLQTGANDVLVVRPTDQPPKGDEILIPFVRSVVQLVDTKKKIIQVDWQL